MSSRCRHGTVVYDREGEHRCPKCPPVNTTVALEDAYEHIGELKARIEELERVVVQLAFSAGITFNLPKEPT